MDQDARIDKGSASSSIIPQTVSNISGFSSILSTRISAFTLEVCKPRNSLISISAEIRVYSTIERACRFYPVPIRHGYNRIDP